MKPKIFLSIAGILFVGLAQGATDDLLGSYRGDGAGPFSSAAGQGAWTQQHPSPREGEPRSCASCHGTDLGQAGRHVKTGKPIEPMALSVNPERLSDPQKVEKWFRRNCRWTLGRECTPQEKGDFVQYLTTQ